MTTDRRRGDRRREAVTQLVDRHGRRLYNIARRLCGNAADAEDLVQETFLAAFRRWDSFEGRSTPETWLYTIARRACMRMHRRKAGQPARLESLDELMPRPSATIPAVLDLDGPHATQMRQEAEAIVERAMARLPMTFRLPLVLADVAELSTAEIARVLGLKEATVKTRVHRARLKLRQVLARGLPQRRAPHVAHPRSLCLDLLRAKLESLDRGVPFAYSDQALCERCRTVFATLDLGRDVCGLLGRGDLPSSLRNALLKEGRELSVQN